MTLLETLIFTACTSQNVMLQKKLALLCGRKRFWSEIRRLNHSRSSNIANLFGSKSEDVLNTHPTSLLQTSVTDFCISEVCFSEDDVLQAGLKRTKLIHMGFALNI